MLEIYDLKTEYLVDPLGIDAQKPRFSWKMKSDRKGVMQLSRRIICYFEGKILWDSGIVENENSQRVHYSGQGLMSRQQVSWKVFVTVTDCTGKIETAESKSAHFEMGLLNRHDWQAGWIEPESDIDVDARKPGPYLRRDFVVGKGLKKARIYQTAHGLYDFWINGKTCTDDCFKPGLTSYYYRIQYQSYDIYPNLREGANTWAVMLGDGWWRGVTGGTVKNNFGYRLHYFGQIELTYEDGRTEIVSTDEQFKYSYGGMLACDMHMGEIFDARKEPWGWKLPGFDDGCWKNVHITREHSDANLIPGRSVPVREKEHFHAKPFRDANGDLVLDFGQNIAGYVRMTLRDCCKGQKVRLVHGEDIKNGYFSVENVAECAYPIDSFQEVIYYCAGNPVEEYTPRFAIFGFRYVLVEGYDADIADDDFIAIAVYSDMEQTGSFECSNPLLNKLVSNSLWSQKGNFMDVPVDCPTRERNAWTGDSQIYARTAAYFMNVYPFFEKWMVDQTLEQYASGKLGLTFPSTSSVHNPEELDKMKEINPMAALAGPSGDGNIAESSAGWGDASVWNPYMMYLCYGDKQILENQYETGKKWVEHMLDCAREHNPVYEKLPQYSNYEDGELDADYIFDTRMHFGEWNEPLKRERGKDFSLKDAFDLMIKYGNPLVATAYMYRSADNISHIAGILGKDDDHKKYKKIAERIRKVYDKYFIADDGTVKSGHQAPYVRVLEMGLCSKGKQDKVVDKLLFEIESNGYRLNTGFLSTPFLLHVLADFGHKETAFRILEQKESPGWLRSVILGSTTIPENWEGIETHSGSFNHYSYGAVCDFLFRRVVGITPLFETPGYKAFEINPIQGGSLTYAKAEYESIYGTIRAGWEINKESIEYEFGIPVNTKATVNLPDGRSFELGSGDYVINCEL